jgi:hypothetical protein
MIEAAPLNGKEPEKIKVICMDLKSCPLNGKELELVENDLRRRSLCYFIIYQ